MDHDSKNFDEVNLGAGGKVGQKKSLVKDVEVSAWQFSKPEAFSRSKEKNKLRPGMSKHLTTEDSFPLASDSALCISRASEERGLGDYMIGAGCGGKLGVRG